MITESTRISEVHIVFDANGGIESRSRFDVTEVRDGETIIRSTIAGVPLTHEQMTELFGVQIANISAQLDTVRSDLESTQSRVVATEGERETLMNTVEQLRAELRRLKGAPTFLAQELLQQFTIDDNKAIAQAVVDSPDLLSLYSRLQQRGSVPIPIDSETFLLGLTGLKKVLGEERARSVFEKINIDIISSSYIN